MRVPWGEVSMFMGGERKYDCWIVKDSLKKVFPILCQMSYSHSFFLTDHLDFVQGGTVTPFPCHLPSPPKCHFSGFLIIVAKGNRDCWGFLEENFYFLTNCRRYAFVLDHFLLLSWNVGKTPGSGLAVLDHEKENHTLCLAE